MRIESKAQQKFLEARKPALARKLEKLSKNKNLPARKGTDKDAASEKKQHSKDGDE